MTKRRFTTEEKVKILREAETGLPGLEIARKHNISEQTLYRWKQKYGGMNVSDARRLKMLEDENARLKRKLAEAILDIDNLKEINSKKW